MSKSRAFLISLFLGFGLVVGFQNCAKKDPVQSAAPLPSVDPGSDFTVEAEYTDTVSRTRKTISATSNTAPVSFNYYFNSANGWFEQQTGGVCTPVRINGDNLVFRFKTKVTITNCKFNFGGFNDSTGNYTDCSPDQVASFMMNGTPLVLNTNRFMITTTNPTNCVQTSTARFINNNAASFDLYLNCNASTCQYRRTFYFTKAGEP